MKWTRNESRISAYDSGEYTVFQWNGWKVELRGVLLVPTIFPTMRAARSFAEQHMNRLGK